MRVRRFVQPQRRQGLAPVLGFQRCGPVAGQSASAVIVPQPDAGVERQAALSLRFTKPFGSCDGRGHHSACGFCKTQKEVGDGR